ncbi:hypothetical protein GIB67_043264, partial [Kingdonia uniflora]
MSTSLSSLKSSPSLPRLSLSLSLNPNQVKKNLSLKTIFFYICYLEHPPPVESLNDH